MADLNQSLQEASRRIDELTDAIRDNIREQRIPRRPPPDTRGRGGRGGGADRGEADRRTRAQRFKRGLLEGPTGLLRKIAAESAETAARSVGGLGNIGEANIGGVIKDTVSRTIASIPVLGTQRERNLGAVDRAQARLNDITSASARFGRFATPEQRESLRNRLIEQEIRIQRDKEANKRFFLENQSDFKLSGAIRQGLTPSESANLVQQGKEVKASGATEGEVIRLLKQISDRIQAQSRRQLSGTR